MEDEVTTLTTMVTVWWLFFWTAVGLMIGSFLNVVIHRLPRNRSVMAPLWSACPHCRHRIRWFDNIPVVSFVLLRGRCRDCGFPISTRYLVVEVAMALLVLVLLDTFFIGASRSGCGWHWGLNVQLSYDWPILVAHIILFACLLCMSAIDLEHYWVDIRFTNIAAISGFVLHTIWTPSHATAWPRPGAALAVTTVFGLGGLAAVWVFAHIQGFLRDPEPEAEEEEDEPEPPAPATSSTTSSQSACAVFTSARPPWRIVAWGTTITLIALLIGLFLEEANVVQLKHGPRVLIPALVFFILILFESSVDRPADKEIVEAIHDERSSARRMVMQEFLYLLPALVLGLLGLWLVCASDTFSGHATAAMDARWRLGSLTILSRWAPLSGFATAAAGYMVGGALGWGVRIVFTLLFGKEAFGTGDIHLMAAAGCVAGWPVVVIGFFLTCGLALLGWLLMLPFKRSRAIPLGPWLALSFLLVVVLYDRIIEWPVIKTRLDMLQHVLR